MSPGRFCLCPMAARPRSKPWPVSNTGSLEPPTQVVLRHQLIHPTINEVLARAGHHAKILIADGNYPVSTKKGPNAELVCLNLSPGVVTVAEVLLASPSAVLIDHVHTMGIPRDDPYARKREPPVWEEFRREIKGAKLKLKLEPIQKWDFYKQVESPDHALTIQTGDQ